MQINVKVAANASMVNHFQTNQTIENNVPIRTETTMPPVAFIPTQQPTTLAAVFTAPPTTTAAIVTSTTLAPVAPNANIFTSHSNRDFFMAADAPLDDVSHVIQASYSQL